MKYSKLVRLLLGISFFAGINIFAEPDVLFTPDSNPIKELIKKINTAQKKLHGAVYMLSDQRVAQALLDAHERKVEVQLVLDEFSFGKLGKGHFLAQNKVPVFIYTPKKQGFFEDHMHNKFMIIDSKELMTGSANWSVAGGEKNQENVLILDSKKIIAKYEAQFKQLKQRCVTYKQFLAHQNSGGVKSLRKEESLDDQITQKQVAAARAAVVDFFKSLFK